MHHNPTYDLVLGNLPGASEHRHDPDPCWVRTSCKHEELARCLNGIRPLDATVRITVVARAVNTKVKHHF